MRRSLGPILPDNIMREYEKVIVNEVIENDIVKVYIRL